jgi:hypothetical protein
MGQGNTSTFDPSSGADTTGAWEVVGNDLRIDPPKLSVFVRVS